MFPVCDVVLMSVRLRQLQTYEVYEDHLYEEHLHRKSLWVFPVMIEGLWETHGMFFAMSFFCGRIIYRAQRDSFIINNMTLASKM